MEIEETTREKHLPRTGNEEEIYVHEAELQDRAGVEFQISCRSILVYC